MKKIISGLVLMVILTSFLLVNADATDIQVYSFDELIVERNVESPYLAKEDIFSEGLAIKEIQYNTGEYINIPGEGNIPLEVTKFGIVDTNNNEVIPCIYDGVSGINSYITSGLTVEDVGISFYSFFKSIVKKPGFYEGVATVKKDGKWGAIDTSGNVVVPFEFSELEAFNEGLAKAQKNDKYGFIDKQGNIVIPMVYDDAEYFYNGYAKVGKYEAKTDTYKYGFIDRKGTLVVPMIYDDVSDFHEGMAAVFNKTEEYYFGNYGFVNAQGQLVVPMIYNDAGNFSNGLAPVAIPDERFSRDKGQKLYGYIDKNGNMVIQPKYSEANAFCEGLAQVTVNSPANVSVDGANFDEPEMSGYIDTNGNEVISFSHNYPSWTNGTENFTCGTAVVYKKDTDEYVRIKNPLIVSVTVNGNYVTFDQPPIIVDDRTLVPVRAIFESLGATVEWHPDTQTVVAQKDGMSVMLQIGSNIMSLGCEMIELDVPAQIINDRTLVPARAVAEAFECLVDWDDTTRTVIINDK